MPTLFDVALPIIQEGYTNIVDDSFTRCFKSQKQVHWNWNAYLLPTWLFGILFRYLILLPLRIFCLLLGLIVTGITFPIVKGLSVFFNTQSLELM